MITYDYYRIFYFVAQYHSFTKAAEILKNNQPNITRCMNNLESELGCKLFIRSHQGVTLTAEGEKVSVWPLPTNSSARLRRSWLLSGLLRAALSQSVRVRRHFV